MQLAADARQLIAHLDARRVDWIGTSMGGLVGMMIAGQSGSPIDRLVLNDIGAYLPMDALKAIARNLEAPESFKSLEAVERHLRRTRADGGPIEDEQWKAMARHHARPLRPGSDLLRLHFDPRIAQIVRPLPFAPGLSFWDAWYRVRCDVLLLRGEHSEVFPADVAETMLDVRPDAELVEIADCGHAPSLMNEDQVTRVRHFLHDGAVKSPGRQRDRKPSLPARAA